MAIDGEVGLGREMAGQGTLGRHFRRDMDGLWCQILEFAGVVESALNTSVRALCDLRADLAAEVRAGEQAINSLEVRIERQCLRILALHQPVACDLRRVTAVLKINGELERMADLAEHIAKRVKKLVRGDAAVPIPGEIEALALEALGQVRDGLDALAHSDAELARSVIASDRRIDRLRRDVQRGIKQAIRDDPDRLDGYLRLINASRNLERVADHATNIAEAVVYLKEGDIIRRASGPPREAYP